MAMPLVHDGLAVGIPRLSSVLELDGLGAETHRATEVLDLLLLGQEVDDGERGLGIHLGRVCALHPRDVPGEIRDGYVHAEADTEIRDLPFARNAAREDFSLPTPRSEPARHEH